MIIPHNGRILVHSCISGVHALGHFSDLYQSGLRECACIGEQICLRRNPFVNHWSTGADVAISLGFVFGLAVFALMYQTYLSVLIFRVLCDVTVRFVFARAESNCDLRFGPGQL